MKDKYLPIGTVCLLKNGKKDVMITGYLPVPNENPNYRYDYCGCVFPEGIFTTEQTAVFNHDQILEIHHMGLENEEYKNFNEQIKKVVENGDGIPPLAITGEETI